MAGEKDDDAPGDEAPIAGLDQESRESLADFFAQFSGGGYQFLVERLEPKQMIVAGKPRRMSGHLETTHTLPTAEYLREHWGGGLYKIRAFARGAKGSRFAGSRRIEIAGDAKLKPEALAEDQAPQVGERPSLDKVYEDKWRSEDRADREIRELRQQAARAAQRPAYDPAIEAIRDAANAQVEAMRLEVQRRDRELSDLRRQIDGTHNRSAFNDPEVLKTIFGRGSEDAERLRDTHRHELAVERDRAARELAAERDRAARELEAMRRDTANQIALVERLHRSDVDNLKAAHQGLLATKDSEIARLAEELRAARATVGKPESLSEQAAKVDQFLEVSQRIAARANGAAPAEDDPKPWYERLFDKDGFAERVAEKVIVLGGNQAPQAHQATPRGRPQIRLVHSAGRRRPPAEATPIAERRATEATATAPERAPVEAAPSAAAASATEAPPVEPTADAAAPVEVGGDFMQGLGFLETALRNGQPAEMVARSALRLFPRAEVAQLVAAGDEQLAVAIEKVAPESVLLSHGGRQYLGDLLGALKKELSPPA